MVAKGSPGNATGSRGATSNRIACHTITPAQSADAAGTTGNDRHKAQAVTAATPTAAPATEKPPCQIAKMRQGSSAKLGQNSITWPRRAPINPQNTVVLDQLLNVRALVERAKSSATATNTITPSSAAKRSILRTNGPRSIADMQRGYQPTGMIASVKRSADDLGQYSSANITVSTRAVTVSSAGSCECRV